MDKPTNNAVADGRRPGWLWIDNATLEHIGAEVGPYGIAVYAAIAMHTSGKGCKAWPGAKRIAEIAGCGVRKVKSTLHDLEDAGVLDIEHREGETSLFTLLNTPLSDEDPDSEGGVHDMHGGGARDARGGVHDMHPNNNHITKTKKEGGANAPSTPRSSSDQPSSDDSSSPSNSNPDQPAPNHSEEASKVEPILNAFRGSGATLTQKRERILLRWARNGFIDNIPLFAEVVQDDYDGKGRILSMKVLRQKYIEAVRGAAKGTARRNGRADAKATPTGDHDVTAPVSHATASEVVQEIRSDIDHKAQLSEYFDPVKQDGTTMFKPTTVARAVLSTRQSESQ